MKQIFSLFLLFISTLFFAQDKAPFVGKRDFNVVDGYNSSGTSSYYVDVKENGDVHLGYSQINQNDGTETTEDINVGKYNSKVMKVNFKRFNETFHFKFDKEKIYLTDEEGNIKKSEDCCSATETENSSCICESTFYQ